MRSHSKPNSSKLSRLPSNLTNDHNHQHDNHDHHDMCKRNLCKHLKGVEYLFIPKDVRVPE